MLSNAYKIYYLYSIILQSFALMISIYYFCLFHCFNPSFHFHLSLRDILLNFFFFIVILFQSCKYIGCLLLTFYKANLNGCSTSCHHIMTFLFLYQIDLIFGLCCSKIKVFLISDLDIFKGKEVDLIRKFDWGCFKLYLFHCIFILLWMLYFHSLRYQIYYGWIMNLTPFYFIFLLYHLQFFILPTIFLVFFLELSHIVKSFQTFVLEFQLLEILSIYFFFLYSVFKIFFEAVPFLKLIHTTFLNSQPDHPCLV